jgi:hypothetical protein
VASPADRARIGVGLSGAWPAETFGGHGRAAWIRPDATLHVPAGAGTLTVRAWAPRPTPADARLVMPGGRSVPLQLGSEPADLHIAVRPDESRAAGLSLRLVSDAFVPADEGTGTDRRELGIVVSEVAFAPPGVSPRPAWWAGGELTVPAAQPPSKP